MKIRSRQKAVGEGHARRTSEPEIAVAPCQPPIPESYLDCVVAIGTEDAQGIVGWVASGFLYGHPIIVEGQRLYQVYLVTNRHVLEGMTQAVLRCNPRGRRPAREYLLQLTDPEGIPAFLTHVRADVAVVPIDFDMLRKHAMAVSFFAGDQHCARRRRWKALGVTEGDEVFVLGFPMGLVGGRRNTVIVRSGTIARIHDTMERASSEFLLDAFVFPGNSGGPVLLRQEGASSLLIGIIRSYVPYQDVAVSMQTQHPRVIFEENSGLSAAHPIDYVISTVQRHQSELRKKGRRPRLPPRARRAHGKAASKGKAAPSTSFKRESGHLL